MGITRVRRFQLILNRDVAAIYARTQRSVHYDSMSHKTLSVADSTPCYLVLLALAARLINPRGALRLGW